jgi:hypothetical protein
MGDYWVSVEWLVRSTPRASDKELEAFLDEILDQLGKIGIEADYTADLRKRLISFDWSIEADDEVNALRRFLADMQTALHAAGARTAHWPKPDDLVRREVRALANA